MSINVTVHGNPISINRGKMVSLDPDKEFALRRKIRLQQVRQQSKEIAEDVRNKVRNERKKQMSKNIKNCEKFLSKKKDEMLQTLNEQYQSNLERFGEAYRNAENEVDPETVIKKVEEHNRNKAEKLGKKAIKNHSRMKQEKENECKERLLNKKNARFIEDIRSKLVSDLGKNRIKKKKKKVASTSIIINGVSEIVSDESDQGVSDLSVIEELSIESVDKSDIDESDKSDESVIHDNDPDLVQLYTKYNLNSSSNDFEFQSDDTISQEYTTNPELSTDQNLNVSQPTDKKPSTTSMKQRKIDFSGFNRDLEVQCKLSDEIVTKASTSREFPTNFHSSVSTQRNAQRSIYDTNVHFDPNIQSDFHPEMSDFHASSTLGVPPCGCGGSCTCASSNIDRNLNVYDDQKSPPKNFGNEKSVNTPKRMKQKLTITNKKVKKKQSDCAIKSNNLKKTILSKKEESPKKSMGFKNDSVIKKTVKNSPKKDGRKIKKTSLKKMEKSSDLPYVSTVMVQPEKSESRTSTVKFYDNSRHINTMVNQPVLVQKISKDSIQVVSSEDDDDDLQEKISKQKLQAEIRGQKAMEKNKLDQVYQQLMEELPVLKRQEQLTSMLKYKQNLHMSDKRLQEYEREKQNRMENAYENIIPNLNTLKTIKKKEHSSNISSIITLKPIKKLPPSDDIKEPFKTLDVTQSSSHILNVGQWEKVNESISESETIPPETTINPETIQVDNEKVITDLLQRINKQRDLLLKEAANLPSLVNLKQVLSEQELLQILCKSPQVIQPKILKEIGTSPLNPKPDVETDVITPVDVPKISSKRVAVTSSSTDTLSDKTRKLKQTKKMKRLPKRSKILIKEEATQTSPSVISTTKIIKEEATQTQSQKITPKHSLTPSDNSDKLCEIIIRASDDRKVEISHRSTETEKSPNKPDISNYVIKVKESDKKLKSKLMEISAGTSYQSLPTDKNKSVEKPKVSNKDLLHPQKVQTNIENLVHVEPDGSKEINPRLVRYIKKLLCMSRQSIDDLTVSNVSDVSTPHDSVIHTENNVAKEKLHSVIEYFKLSSNDIQKYLSSSSTLTSSELSLENEIKEIMKPAFLSSGNTSTSQTDPGIDLKYTSGYTSESKLKSDTHGKKSISPEVHKSKTKSPEVHKSKTKSPEVHKSKTKSPDVYDSKTKSPDVYDSKPKSPDYTSRPKSPEAHAKRPRTPKKDYTSHQKDEYSFRPNSPPLSLQKSPRPKTAYKSRSDGDPKRPESPIPSTSKVSPKCYFPDELERPESRKQFSVSNDSEKFTSIRPTTTRIIKKEEVHHSISPQKICDDRPKTATSPTRNIPSELLKVAQETLGMSTEEFDKLGIDDVYSHHSELTEYCQTKIGKLVNLLEKLRSEKISIRTPSPEDPCSITITSYLDLPDKSGKNKDKSSSSSSSSSISQETIDKYLLTIEPNPIPPTKKHKEADVSDGNKFVSDTTETFVPMLQGIPKYGEETKPKPPPSLLRANMRGYVDVVPHELSTIVEADTLISSRNTSLQQPKTPMKTPMKLTEKIVQLEVIKSIPAADISKEIDSSSLFSGDYLTITPDISNSINHSKSPRGSKSPRDSKRDSKSPKNKSTRDKSLVDIIPKDIIPKDKSPKNKSPKSLISTTTTNQDIVQNYYAKSSMSGIQPLSDSTNTSPDELESLLRKFKLEWAISLVKKTEQALALSSSSSTSELDSKLKSSDLSATDLYKQLYKKLLSSNSSEPERSQILSDLSSQFHDVNELSKIQNITLFKVENKSDSRNKSQQQRTSTPVQLSNSSGSFSKENLFKGDSEISSVRNSSDENMFLTIPNISLNTTNCSLNKSKK